MPPKNIDIHLFETRNGKWRARVTFTHANGQQCAFRTMEHPRQCDLLTMIPSDIDEYVEVCDTEI